MNRLEYDLIAQPIWGETDLLQKIIDRNFHEITDDDFELIKDWFRHFCSSRCRYVEIVEIGG